MHTASLLSPYACMPSRNASVPKNSVNDKSKYKTAISILVITNHNSFRALLDKIAPYILFEEHIFYFSIGNGQPREPALCQLYRHTFVPYTRAFQLSDSMCIVACLSLQLHRIFCKYYNTIQYSFIRSCQNAATYNDRTGEISRK